MGANNVALSRTGCAGGVDARGWQSTKSTAKCRASTTMRPVIEGRGRGSSHQDIAKLGWISCVPFMVSVLFGQNQTVLPRHPQPVGIGAMHDQQFNASTEQRLAADRTQ